MSDFVPAPGSKVRFSLSLSLTWAGFLAGGWDEEGRWRRAPMAGLGGEGKLSSRPAVRWRDLRRLCSPLRRLQGLGTVARRERWVAGRVQARLGKGRGDGRRVEVGLRWKPSLSSGSHLPSLSKGRRGVWLLSVDGWDRASLSWFSSSLPLVSFGRAPSSSSTKPPNSPTLPTLICRHRSSRSSYPALAASSASTSSSPSSTPASKSSERSGLRQRCVFVPPSTRRPSPSHEAC